ncbi:phosphoribosylformylglycinamidine synthase I [Chloroflexota bacterium]
MAKVRTLILRAPGTNCDRETAFAFEQSGAVASLAHVNRLISKEQKLSDYQILVIPGGFTYGDDITAGKVLANELRLNLGDDIREFVAGGGLILGICNGFQVLVKTCILPGPMSDTAPGLTLMTNDSGKFECRWVHLKVNNKSACIFTKGIDQMYLPVAHAEGKFVVEPGIMPQLDVALHYSNESGSAASGYPANPNGSVENIAGICDSSGRIFALMPHPERYIRNSQSPQWTRQKNGTHGDGFRIFQNAVSWAKNI